MFTIFFLLIVGHCIADYPLQGDFLSKAKNRFNPLPGVPWYHGLFPHAIIHAGAVWVVTHSMTLAVLEFICHAAIDDTKCRGKISYDQDQALHIICKIIWVVIFVNVENLP